MDRRRRGTGLASEVEEGVRRAPGRLGSTRGAPVVAAEGSAWPEMRRRRVILSGQRTHRRWFSAEFPAAVGRIRGQKLRCASARRGGTKTGSCRGGAVAERRGHVGAEVRHGGAAAERRARVWGRRLQMREPGGAARWLKGAGPGISGVRLGKEIRENFGRAPRPLRSERCAGEKNLPVGPAWQRVRRGVRAGRARGGGRPRDGPGRADCCVAVLGRGWADR